MRALLGTVLLLACPAVAAEPDALDAIAAGLRAHPHVAQRFFERRFLSILRTPLETRGTLRFDAPDRLEKTGDPGPEGAAERIVVAGDTLALERPGAPPLTLSLREHPEVGALAAGVRALLAGDAAALRRDFTVAVAGSPAAWQMVLTPHRAELVRWLRIDGQGGAVTRIETQEAGGDRSELVVGDTPPRSLGP